VQEQEREDRALLRAAEVQEATLLFDFERAEDPELHALSRLPLAPL
jgi:hypothetical protein